MAHENILLNNGDDLLLNDGSSVVLLNLESPGIHIANVHAVADLRGAGRRRRRRRSQTVMEAVGQISRIKPFTGTARLFKKNTLQSISTLTVVFFSICQKIFIIVFFMIG